LGVSILKIRDLANGEELALLGCVTGEDEADTKETEKGARP
jgi:hypothetical protein